MSNSPADLAAIPANAHTSTTSTLRSQHRFSWMSAREGMLGGVKEKGSLAGAAVVVPDDYRYSGQSCTRVMCQWPDLRSFLDLFSV